ncbi:hypothetical protein KTN05_14830 [Paracoccus sp. Z118]|uniref:DUF6884 domain-containing protein n=1 Tax=Paracoccus sp. Z118 TaxID=2851017 RepID=UPI001C2C94E3|nr:DUF6884 domain-containing protein [Paracoccus sp. Z118]MBV0893095.1 hypothetical protein [Paracoccus sp. Z118]
MDFDDRERPIVLISCVKSKRNAPSKARDLYTSPLFKKMMSYALLLDPKEIYILSALHGLLELDKVISPYEKTLNNMKVKDRKEWSDGVLASLEARCDLQADEFVLLAGKKYSEFLTPRLAHVTEPMDGLSQGKRLRWLNEQYHV